MKGIVNKTKDHCHDWLHTSFAHVQFISTMLTIKMPTERVCTIVYIYVYSMSIMHLLIYKNVNIYVCILKYDIIYREIL